MTCPRCRRAMREEKRAFHKQRKWICPHCGRVRFQQNPPPKKKK
jgi:transposase-like protein